MFQIPVNQKMAAMARLAVSALSSIRLTDWRAEFGTKRRGLLHTRLAGGYSPAQVRDMNGRNGVGNPCHRKHPGARP